MVLVAEEQRQEWFLGQFACIQAVENQFRCEIEDECYAERHQMLLVAGKQRQELFRAEFARLLESERRCRVLTEWDEFEERGQLYGHARRHRPVSDTLDSIQFKERVSRLELEAQYYDQRHNMEFLCKKQMELLPPPALVRIQYLENLFRWEIERGEDLDRVWLEHKTRVWETTRPKGPEAEPRHIGVVHEDAQKDFLASLARLQEEEEQERPAIERERQDSVEALLVEQIRLEEEHRRWPDAHQETFGQFCVRILAMTILSLLPLVVYLQLTGGDVVPLPLSFAAAMILLRVAGLPPFRPERRRQPQPVRPPPPVRRPLPMRRYIRFFRLPLEPRRH
ncbi:hypothetical protein, conserved [Angomonas deanei]|uniref:Uncharacterized protein n=1 Tax=Angomonas deanei TaxID=59799 RepID=A0A7G2CVQ2_9TRYP|nr:hypothetical protein, conserved [Angomonas deanei]